MTTGGAVERRVKCVHALGQTCMLQRTFLSLLSHQHHIKKRSKEVVDKLASMHVRNKMFTKISFGNVL